MCGPTDLDRNATILSIDGVRVFDLVSRNAFGGIVANERRRPHLAFCPSLLWRPFRVLVGGREAVKTMRSIDAHSVWGNMQPVAHEGESLLAFLDDLFVITPDTNRSVDVRGVVAPLQNHHGKTRIWNPV